jgi:uncharacterized protein (TIGR03067 family)
MFKGGRVTLAREAAMKTRLGAVLLVMAFASAGVAVGGDAKAELKKFQGTWAVESSQDGGKAPPAKLVKLLTITFSGDRFTVRFGDKVVEDGKFKIDSGKKPGHIDLPSEGKTAPGIYAFEGGKLKICFNDGGGRPTAFRSPEGSKISLMVLKRAKK